MDARPFNQPDERIVRQQLYNRQRNEAKFVGDAIIRVAIILQYLNGKYILLDFNAPEFIGYFISWRGMLKSYLMKKFKATDIEFENQVRHPNHGDSSDPINLNSPIAIMISANGNICWEGARIQPMHVNATTDNDWRISRAWNKNAVKGTQMMNCDDRDGTARFFYLPTNHPISLKFKFPARMPGGDNRFSDHSISQLIMNNIICDNDPLEFDNEADLINYAQNENICYIDSAGRTECNSRAPMGDW
ncbi:polyhedrin [Lutzomyia reovirus 1]|uniref:polyhedrin n=1 Tax=Lutzomyia reovirus 1 TaxID=1670669 RepID=UPI00065EEB4C|nr:polyhedrin [Lutzomyia reovirus 1]AKP18607.1 polyhedrin [Lutzomyia reovirus 1]